MSIQACKSHRNYKQGMFKPVLPISLTNPSKFAECLYRILRTMFRLLHQVHNLLESVRCLRQLSISHPSVMPSKGWYQLRHESSSQGETFHLLLDPPHPPSPRTTNSHSSSPPPLLLPTSLALPLSPLHCNCSPHH